MDMLPEEILEDILSFLQPTLQTPYWSACSLENRPKYQALTTVCRISKKLRRLAVPVLYHTIELYAPEAYGDYQPEISGCPSNMKLLLRTLLHNAGLSAHIKHLKVEYFKTAAISFGRRFKGAFPCRSPGYRSFDLNLLPDYQSLAPVAGALTVKDQEQFNLVIQDLGLSNGLRAHLEEAIAVGIEECELAVVLGLCSCLEYLELTTVANMRNTLFMAVIDELIARLHEASISASTATQRSLPFSKLLGLAVRQGLCLYSFSNYDATAIESLTRAPVLQSVQGSAMTISMSRSSGKFLFPSRNSQVVRLRIDHGSIDESGLALVLRKNPSIREFSWHSTLGSFITNMETIGLCLEEHGHNLETIVLKPQVWGSQPSVRSLRRLKKLRFLTASTVALLGSIDIRKSDRDHSLRLIQILPESLEVLELADLPVEVNPSAIPLFWVQIDNDELCPLMLDARFHTLSTIRLERKTPFDCDVLELGWEESRDGEFVVLNRRASLFDSI